MKKEVICKSDVLPVKKQKKPVFPFSEGVRTVFNIDQLPKAF